MVTGAYWLGAGRGWLAAGQVIEVTSELHCMWPIFQPGDRVRVAVARAPRNGDVVAAMTEAGPVLHRVVESRGDTYVLAGDRSARFDAPVGRADILGVATHVRKSRWWVSLDGPVGGVFRILARIRWRHRSTVAGARFLGRLASKGWHRLR